MESEEFDPRFDPAFQPGFDPEKHRSSRRRVFRSSASTVGESTGAAAPVPQSGTVANLAHQAASHPVRSQATPDGVAYESSHSGGDGEPHSVPLGQNPYVRALWFVSAGLLVGGFLLYWWANSDVGIQGWEGSSPPFIWVLQQSSWVVVPAMMTVGLAGLVGLLFLYAIRWRPEGTVDEEQAARGPLTRSHHGHGDSSAEQLRPTGARSEPS
ncbi:hypothetical protein [Homoserinimonas sp. OAct 916]|uniref:hypothetical protein n=1 Tax=Homoserinimonas sp. OAct 916 TaxID=2211450 RepID=UPI000DBE7754|nr:hypothetical protein [Homoserinimonas sp. OAct 916]